MRAGRPGAARSRSAAVRCSPLQSANRVRSAMPHGARPGTQRRVVAALGYPARAGWRRRRCVLRSLGLEGGRRGVAGTWLACRSGRGDWRCPALGARTRRGERARKKRRAPRGRPASLGNLISNSVVVVFVSSAPSRWRGRSPHHPSAMNVTVTVRFPHWGLPVGKRRQMHQKSSRGRGTRPFGLGRQRRLPLFRACPSPRARAAAASSLRPAAAGRCGCTPTACRACR